MEGQSKPRSTKIVSTIGPATSAADQIRRLILAGMDVAMLNFSHGDHDSHRETLHLLNEPMSELLPITPSSISRAACQMAEDLGAAAIVAGTSSGSTARLVARFRPACPIVGLTLRVLTQRQLTLSWGVIPALMAHFGETEEMFGLSGSWVLGQGLARQGDRVIVTAGVPVGVPGTMNLVRMIEIKWNLGASPQLARPGATEVGQCLGKKNPVWAREYWNIGFKRCSFLFLFFALFQYSIMSAMVAPDGLKTLHFVSSIPD